jgi:hypothetical protein
MANRTTRCSSPPVLAWTRYMIPSGPLKGDVADALRAHLQAHVLASGTRVGLAPFLYSIDQLPRHHVETYRLAQQLAHAAIGQHAAKLSFGDLPETSPILADPRFLLAVVAAPAGAPLFRWQEEEHGNRIERGQCPSMDRPRRPEPVDRPSRLRVRMPASGRVLFGMP